jgi:hypothetical protein
MIRSADIVSGDFLPPSPPAEKPTTCQNEALGDQHRRVFFTLVSALFETARGADERTLVIPKDCTLGCRVRRAHRDYGRCLTSATGLVRPNVQYVWVLVQHLQMLLSAVRQSQLEVVSSLVSSSGKHGCNAQDHASDYLVQKMPMPPGLGGV